MRRSSTHLILVCILPCLVPWGCQGPPAPPRAELVAVMQPVLPREPQDPVWQDAPEHVARLILQDLVEPRQMEVSTPEVRMRAIRSSTAVAFRMEWPDPTRDDLTGPSRFSDACAVQLPGKAEPTVPAPQMGEAGRGVEISLWRASWQADVDGRPDSIQAIYPNAAVDHYPFEAPSLPEGSEAQREMSARYSPARSLGNRMSGPRQSPVEDLLAEGPGTLIPAPAQASRGRGVHGHSGWSVVISRPVPAGLGPRDQTHVAVAIWEGSGQEAGSRKMRTGWIPLLLEAPER